MKTKQKKGKLTAWISIILLLVFAVAHTTLVINPLIVRVSSAKINADVQHGINDILYESILHDLSYKDIFVIERMLVTEREPSAKWHDFCEKQNVQLIY